MVPATTIEATAPVRPAITVEAGPVRSPASVESAAESGMPRLMRAFRSRRATVVVRKCRRCIARKRVFATTTYPDDRRSEARNYERSEDNVLNQHASAQRIGVQLRAPEEAKRPTSPSAATLS
jgi:hypothetical protein